MGDSYRDELKKRKAKAYPSGAARSGRDSPAGHSRSKALAWQQSRKAFLHGKRPLPGLLDA